VVPLQRSFPGHLPLKVFKKFILISNFLRKLKFLSRLSRKPIPYNFREAVCKQIFLPVGLFDEKIRRMGALAVLPILLINSKPSPILKIYSSHIFRDWFVGKEDGLRTYKSPCHDVGDQGHFYIKGTVA